MTANRDISVVIRMVRGLTKSDAAHLAAASRRAWVERSACHAARDTAAALVARARPTPSNVRREIEQAWAEAAWAAHPDIPAGAWFDSPSPVDEDWTLALEVAYEAALGLMVASRDADLARLLVAPWRAVMPQSGR